MPLRGRVLRLILPVIVLITVSAGSAHATTTYYLRLHLGQLTGDSLLLACAFTSPNVVANNFTIENVSQDGRMRVPVLFSGGPVSGELLITGIPASATARDTFFDNEIQIPLDSTGTMLDATLNLAENGAGSGDVPDELAFSILHPDESPAFPVGDPFDSGTLFTIDVTGTAGGDLSVYAPMQFIAPDTLLMANTTTDVPLEATGRQLRFTGVRPNPSHGSVIFAFEVPETSGQVELRIYDILGRLVAVPIRETARAGTWTKHWDGRSRTGSRLPSGVYLAELRVQGISTVRRMTITR